MTSSFQGGTFDPIQQESFVEVNQRHAARQLADLERYYTAMNRNAQRRVDISQRDLDKLAPFSKQIPEVLGQLFEKQKERRQLDAQEWYFTNGLSEDELKEYQDKKNGIKKDYKELSDIRNNDPELKEDWATSERFVNLAPWKQTLILELHAAQKASQYSLADNHELNATTDPAEYNALLVKNRREFLKQFNGINPAVLEENVYKKIREVENAHYKNWNARRKKDVDDKNVNLVQETTYTAIRNGGGGYEEFNFGLSTIGYMDGEINDLYGSYLGNLISTESLTPDQFTNIGNQQIPVRGGKEGETKSFKDHPVFRSMYKELGIKFEKMAGDKYTREFKKRKANFKEQKRDQLQAWADDPTKLTPANVQAAKISLNKQFKNEFASDFDDFDELLENFSISAQALEKQRNRARKQIEAGTFTNYEYSELPPILRLETEFSKAAKEQTNVSPLRLENLETLETLITNRISNNKTLRSSVTTTKAIKTTKNQYLQLVDDYVFNGKTLEEAHKAAYIDVKKWWEANKDNLLSEDLLKGYDLDKFADVTGGRSAELALKKQEMKDYINVFGNESFDQKATPESLYGENASFVGTRKELLRIKKEMGGPNFVPNAKIRWLQEMFNGHRTKKLDYKDVVNLALAQIGEDPIDSTPSFDAASELNETSKEKLFKAKTAVEFVRAWGTFNEDTGKTFIPEIVPDNAGEEILKSSQELNMDPAEIAAAYELNMRYPELLTMNINPDEMDSYMGTDYWLFMYKYSGGSNKQALENTKRF